MIAVGLMLAGYNLYDSFRAERAALEIVEQLEVVIAPAVTPLPMDIQAGSHQGIIDEDLPEALVATDMPEMPVAIDVRQEIEIPDYILNPNMEMPVRRQNGQDYIGILEIPALDLTLPVISEWNYPRLRIAPCRYSGSAYKNNLVISAHNYASHFGSLKNMDGGERVVFTDVDGNRFDYRVELRETLGPKDVDYMIDSGWDLTLFTCTAGGSYRIAVRCTLI